MKVAGIDYSTHAVEVVLVDVDDGAACWFHYDLPALGDAFERAREVAQVLPARRSVFWDDTAAAAIEEPNQRGPAAMNFVPKLKMIQGAILACIPGHVAVVPLDAKSWRKNAGMEGNASKLDVATWAIANIPATPAKQPVTSWTQDAFDAYAMAVACLSKMTITQPTNPGWVVT